MPVSPERRRLLGAVVVLFAIYVVYAALGDARAWSGSDAGGKVATVKVMAETGSWRPDVGYWAERADPKGVHHPLLYTTRTKHGWVQVTSLPFVYLAVPLWKLGGANAILLVPILGSVLGVVAARRLALALGAPTGWPAFWLAGLASPLFFYAADFWEHGAAVALGLLGGALVLESGGTSKALVAGLCFGTAATMRGELLVYAVVLGAVVLAVRGTRPQWVQRPGRAVAAVIGFATPLACNTLLERAVIGQSVRADRLGANAGAAGSELGRRLSDGMLTGFSLFPDERAVSFVFGVLVVAALFVLGQRVVRPRPGEPLGKAAGGLLGALYLLRFVDGLGFVPGMFPAAPMAGVGLATADDTRKRVVTAAALASMPVIWAFQWRGQLLPQWGGRYVLLSGAFLAVVGAVALERAGLERWPSRLAVALALAVTLFGVAWHVDRTRSVARAGAALGDVPPDVVVVSRIEHLGRELGAFYGDRRWLNASGDVPGALRIARLAGTTTVDVVAFRDGQGVVHASGWHRTSTRTVDFLGFALRVDRYAAR